MQWAARATACCPLQLHSEELSRATAAIIIRSHCICSQLLGTRKLECWACSRSWYGGRAGTEAEAQRLAAGCARCNTACRSPAVHLQAQGRTCGDGNGARLYRWAPCPFAGDHAGVAGKQKSGTSGSKAGYESAAAAAMRQGEKAVPQFQSSRRAIWRWLGTQRPLEIPTQAARAFRSEEVSALPQVQVSVSQESISHPPRLFQKN